MRNTYICLFFVVSQLLFGCEKNDDLTCGHADPLSELEWLSEKKTMVDESCSSVILSLFQAKYKRSTVFYTMITDPRVQAEFSVTLCNCDGEVVKVFGNSDLDEYLDKVKESMIIYSCESNK